MTTDSETPETREFAKQRSENVENMRADLELRNLTQNWFDRSCRYKYSYNFSWMGRPIIQYPQDMIAMQEIIWSVQPDLIVETGIAHGGSLIFYASMLELIGGDARVLGLDIEIRPHNRQAIERHPMYSRIEMIEGSSIDPRVADHVSRRAEAAERVLLVLDSNHTHQHVLEELRLYSPLVRAGSYIVVFDTVIEDMPQGSFPDRPWAQGDNPKTAVHAFLTESDRFEIDHAIDGKLLITVAPDGFLKCIRN